MANLSPLTGHVHMFSPNHPLLQLYVKAEVKALYIVLYITLHSTGCRHRTVTPSKYIGSYVIEWVTLLCPYPVNNDPLCFNSSRIFSYVCTIGQYPIHFPIPFTLLHKTTTYIKETFLLFMN